MKPGYLQRVRILHSSATLRHLEYSHALSGADLSRLTQWATDTYGVPVTVASDIIPESASASREFAALLAWKAEHPDDV